MIRNHMNFLRALIAAAVVCGGLDAFAVQAPNPRGSSLPQNARSNDSVNVSRATVSRSPVRLTTARDLTHGAIISAAERNAVARSATMVQPARSATARNAKTARTATTPKASRAATSRVTAVYSDTSKIGSGYAACRESYATCMDQFCATANDTYGRCFCSSRYNDFRNTEDKLDQAATLLLKFADNNLYAVDKNAAEVNAMYSATVGEAAIKNDTSAAAKMLDEIGDLLSGKKKSNTSKSTVSLGVLTFDLTDDIEDIWSDGGSSLFGSGQSLSELEGLELYNAANKQCMNLISGNCENSAVANMARSSYGILITQGCNAYQKNLDKKREKIKSNVRQAEKYLREARLDDYHAHNSADVNECISKVRSALTADTACGANYKRCLDYTGVYINQTTGEPIYSPRLFELTDIITLSGVTSDVDGDMDVLGQNPEFNRFLESRKMFASAALDTCRDISDLVWNEFKRTALIEIAQAQDEKIEEVKMSCVSTMAECYDTQSSALKEFDNTTAQMVGAISAYAAKQMCVDKVSACAALFSNNGTNIVCEFDEKGRLISEKGACGLTALVDFVNAVDDIRIAEGCEDSLRNYAKQLCTPTSGDMGYPWNCRLRTSEQIKNNISNMAKNYCGSDYVNGKYKTVDEMVVGIVNEVTQELGDAMVDLCDKHGGFWQEDADEYESSFYLDVYGTNGPTGNVPTEYGVCAKDTVKARCEIANAISGSKGYATYNTTAQRCVFSLEFYKYQCDLVRGKWANNRCYLDRQTD